MAELGEVTVKLKIDPEMTEEAKAMLRQIVREEVKEYLRQQMMLWRWSASHPAYERKANSSSGEVTE